MKQKLTAIAMCIMAIGVFAQDKADIVVGYEVSSRNWETDTLSSYSMTLLANTKEAKYFNDLSLWSDSLSSTPEGKKQLQDIIMTACMVQMPGGGVSIDFRKGPVKKINNYVFTNLNDNNLRLYDKFADYSAYYDEPLDEMQWQMGDSTMTVLGYECVMAHADYHGRRWTAWFAPEIPVPFGPWKFHGLPGLILKVAADNGREYVATGIENTERIITPIYSHDDYQKVDRRKALAEDEYYNNNRESIIQAKYGGNVKFENISERPKYNADKYAIEPDYK